MKATLPLGALFGLSLVLLGASLAPAQQRYSLGADMQSVEQALLETADLNLPSADQPGITQPGTTQRRYDPQVRPVAAQAPALQQRTEPRQRKTLFGLMKSNWPFKKDSEQQEPASDPFAQAAAKGRADQIKSPAKQTLAQTKPQAAPSQPIVKQPLVQRSEPIERTSMLQQLGTVDPNEQPAQPAASEVIPASVNASPTGKHGARSRLRPGAGKSDTQANTLPLPNPSSRYADNSYQSNKKPAARSNNRQQRTARQQRVAEPKSFAAKSAPGNLPLPMPSAASRATPSDDDLMMPPGDLVFVDDSGPLPLPTEGKPADLKQAKQPELAPIPQPTLAEAKAPAAKSAPEPSADTGQEIGNLLEGLAEQKQAIEPNESLADLPAPTPTPAPTPNQLEQDLPEPAGTPFPVTDAIAQDAPEQVTTPEEETAPQEPSDRTRSMLAEAHTLAETADSIDSFTGIVERCRYVLATDRSPAAIEYANQLASWALNKRGEALDKLGRRREAEANFHDALACDPECWRAVHNLGVADARRGDTDSALERYNRTLELNPEFAKAYASRATIAVQRGEYGAAISDYHQAIDCDPDLAIAHCGCGRLCHLLGRLDTALRHLDAAKLLAPDNANIATSRGDLLVDLGRYAQAKTAYESAISLDPNSMAAYRNLAWMQATCPVADFRDGQAALANAKLAEELSLSEDDITFDTIAAALASLGRFEEALAVQQKAIDLAPEGESEAYELRLSMYENGEAFTSQPVAPIRQAAYEQQGQETETH